jgi:undecaprenyl diphosphate synthase
MSIRSPEVMAPRHIHEATEEEVRSSLSDSSVAPGEDWFAEYGIRHVAIIPDGNRRWANLRGVPTEIGHATGLLRVLPELVSKLCEAGVHTVTVWGFSTENWSRETAEVNHLMAISAQFLCNQVMDIARRHDARVHHLGRKDRLFPAVLDALDAAEKATVDNHSHVYNVALDYGGQDELMRASERMARAVQQGNDPAAISLVDFLDTAGQPHSQPDLVIRSSGEHRMSGFLPLQTTYSELFFVEEMFPDFTFGLLRNVAKQFKWRKRRFGA